MSMMAQKTSEAQVYWHESAKNVNAKNCSPQATANNSISRIPSNKRQTTVTVQIDRQHVEDNLVYSGD